LPFDKHPALSTYNVVFVTLAVQANIVEWLMSMSAIQVVIDSALTIIALALLVEMTPLMGALFKYFRKKFWV